MNPGDFVVEELMPLLWPLCENVCVMSGARDPSTAHAEADQLLSHAAEGIPCREGELVEGHWLVREFTARVLRACLARLEHANEQSGRRPPGAAP